MRDGGTKEPVLVVLNCSQGCTSSWWVGTSGDSRSGGGAGPDGPRGGPLGSSGEVQQMLLMWGQLLLGVVNFRIHYSGLKPKGAGKDGGNG